MMAIEADELTWAYFFSYYDIGLSYNTFTREYIEVKTKDGTVEKTTYKRETVSQSLNLFEQRLKPWIYHQWLNWSDLPMPERIQKAATAADEISKGLALYLSKNPKEEVRIAKYFRPIPATTFDRKYKKFAIMSSRKLFPKIVSLSNKIHEYTKKEE